MAPAGVPAPAGRKPEYEIKMKSWHDTFMSCTRCSEVRTSEQPKPGPNANSLSAGDTVQLPDVNTHTHTPPPSHTLLGLDFSTQRNEKAYIDIVMRNKNQTIRGQT